MIYIGVDPGASGGIARLGDGLEPRGWKMPDTERDISDLVEFLAEQGERHALVCLIENVSSRPGQGVRSVFSFGRNYGFLRGLLIAHKIPFEEVAPGKWQAAMGVKSVKDEPKTAHKNRLKARAQQLFPGLHVTLATADALLIAEYARRHSHLKETA